MNEFDIIRNFFASQKNSRDDVILGIGDDCAIVAPPPNQQIVITTDTLVAGVHFLENTAADDIAFKSLAVNLSDLAAMGATPAWVTLALTLPHANQSWLEKFSRGFFALAAAHNVQLIGGDLTHGPLSVTIQALGFVPPNEAIRRNTAKPGDLIYVTHTVGDAALALAFLQHKINIKPDFQNNLLQRLNRPIPQIKIGEKLRQVASAAIDISDGLIADLKHILENSHVGAIIHIDAIPMSQALRESVSQQEALSFALNGGDDYELCFTVPQNKKNVIPENCTCIGEITESTELTLRFADGTPYNLEQEGYQHF